MTLRENTNTSSKFIGGQWLYNPQHKPWKGWTGSQNISIKSLWWSSKVFATNLNFKNHLSNQTECKEYVQKITWKSVC